MLKIVGLFAGIALAFGIVSTAGAEPAEAEGAYQHYRTCLAQADAAMLATPTWTQDTAVARQFNFAKFVDNNIDHQECFIEFQKELKQLKIPGDDRDAQIAAAEARITKAEADAAFFDSVRCFDYNGGGGIECVASGSVREGILQSIGWIS